MRYLQPFWERQKMSGQVARRLPLWGIYGGQYASFFPDPYQILVAGWLCGLPDILYQTI
jgi:hypothetical protein